MQKSEEQLALEAQGFHFNAKPWGYEQFTPAEEQEWQENHARWLSAPLPVPEAIDMRQASLKLLSEPHGGGTRLDAVDAYVATQDRMVRIEWERAKELRRDHPMVGIMGFFFGMDSDNLDQWFREAAAIGPTLAL